MTFILLIIYYFYLLFTFDYSLLIYLFIIYLFTFILKPSRMYTNLNWTGREVLYLPAGWSNDTQECADHLCAR